MKQKKNVKDAQAKFDKLLHQKFDCGLSEGLLQVTKENNRMKNTAIFYRGTKITYEVMFENARMYANSMASLGITKGSIVPLVMNHCPDTIYTILAASFLGATIAPLSEHFDKDFLIERIKKSNSKVIFVTDDKYLEVKDILKEAGIEKIVMFSLHYDYAFKSELIYEPLEKEYYDGIDRVSEYMESDDRIINAKEFTSLGDELTKDHDIELPKGSLEDIFSITFSSGTTNVHKPKPIMHKVGSYLGLGLIRTLETPDIAKFSKDNNIKVLVHIPIYSDTSLRSSIFDGLYLGYTLCLEHIYSEDFFPKSLLINKPHMCIASRSFWVSAMKEFDTNPEYENASLKDLFAAFVAGEPMSAGEEKYINRVFKKLHVAQNIPVFDKINALGIGAGDCENCGLWRNPHKATFEKIKKITHPFSKVEKGYETYSVVDWDILNENKEHCKPNEHGLLVIDAPFTMVGYEGMTDATNQTKIQDSNGKTWTNANVWSYYDKYGEVFVKGRFSGFEDYPSYLIDDAICQDTKNILSSQTVKLEDGSYVANIDIYPGKNPNLNNLLWGIESRLALCIPYNILEHLVYKIRPSKHSFPLTGSGKRDIAALQSEAISGYIPVKTDENIDLMPAEDYIKTINDAKKFSIKPKNN